MLDELLNEYVDLFGENFPVYAVRGSMTEKEMIDVLKECISEKLPYQIEEDNNKLDY